MAFRSAGWWDLEGRFAQQRDAEGRVFSGSLVALDGARLVSGRDFNADGTLATEGLVRLDEPDARSLADRLARASLTVRSVDEKPYTARPQAPFMTSTLQQEAGRKLRFDARRTMQVAQRLYENGYITYMRTDSTTLSETALTAARDQARSLYGAEYVPDKPRIYAKKVKNAQEAHEAIRPAGERFRTPDEVARELGPDEVRVYDLIWKRTVASQMADARGQTVQVRFAGTTDPAPNANGSSAAWASAHDAEFATSGKVITFPGFLRAYVQGADDPEAELEDQERPLPPLAVGDTVVVRELEPKSHATSPPARYTEATLVKALEDLGVGRPSTYASTIGTIQDRGYVWKKGSALVPSWIAFAVVTLLERHFPALVDYAFTARLEDDLDEIANKAQERVPWLRHFYFGDPGDGDGLPGLKALVTDRLDDIDARDVNSIPIGKDSDGVDLVVRVGRYGPYLQRGDDRASLPEDVAPDELTVERALELLAAPQGPRELGTDPVTGLPVTVRSGRFGAYVQLGDIEEGSKAKPPRASLFKSMTPETVTFEEAQRLLSLPRVVGTDPADGVEITAQNGKYGPYIKKGTDSRSIADEEQLLSISLEEALQILAQPKRGRGQGAAKPPLKELGADPVSGRPMVVKDGRFGPYVTDGETNASLQARAGDTVEEITPERGAELLRVRREAGPAKKRGAKKSAARKAPAARKSAAKKTGAKAAGAVKKAGGAAKKAPSA
jgi:DNA topoisomerase-1